MNRSFALLIALSAVALFAAGCGSSDDGTTDSTASLTKAEFVKQGNAICKAGNEEVNSEFEKFAEEHNISENKPPTKAQLEEAAEEFLVPSVSRQVEEVADLGAPEGEEEAFEMFIEDAEGRVEEAETDPSLMVSEDEDPFEEVKKEATALGLAACGEEEG
jgi:nitrous oxide reductase accessory protein NosL